jgi:hypothetical protein
MKSLIGISGWLLFIGLCINFAANCKERWRIGPLGMPETMVGPDGLHYLDGAEIDPVTLGLHEVGIEQEAEWALCAVLASVLLYLAYQFRKLRRTTRELDRLLQEKEALLRQSGYRNS